MKNTARKRRNRHKTVHLSVLFLLLLLAGGLVLLFRPDQAPIPTDVPTEEADPPEKHPFLDDGIDVVCLDAGHGFGDVGCQSEYLGDLDEKDITIAMVLRLKAALEEQGITVLLTHDGEKYPSVDVLNDLATEKSLDYEQEKFIDNAIYSPYERCIYANALHTDQPIDLMISLHVNSNPHTEYCREFVIDFCAENSSTPLSERAAKGISDALLSDFDGYEVTLLADIWEESYIVTKFTEMPSMLIEMGYASNIFDAVNLLSEDWREKFISSLTRGIVDYFS